MAFYHRAYWSLRCRDPIAVNFLSQGWVNIPRLWKTFPLQFQYLVALKRVIIFLVSSFIHASLPVFIGHPTLSSPREIGSARSPLCSSVPSVVSSQASRKVRILTHSSRHDSVRACTPRAVANPRLYKPFTGFTPLRTPHNPVLYSG
jgi:hypothetical protein